MTTTDLLYLNLIRTLGLLPHETEALSVFTLSMFSLWMQTTGWRRTLSETC